MGWMRGIALLVLFLVPQGSREERGKFKLTFFGREAGFEDYRLEEFEDGQVVLFSKARYEVEVQGKKQAFEWDTVLTMDRALAPLLYAGHYVNGPERRHVKLEFKGGAAHAEGRKPARTAAVHLLDPNVHAQLLPLLRRGGRKAKVFSPVLGSDLEAALEEKGEVVLRGREETARAKEVRVTIGPIDLTVHVDSRKRVLRVWNATAQALAELQGFEGAKVEPAPPQVPRPEGVEEAEVSFGSGEVALAGSVTKPRGGGPFPAVVLVSDAGPHDREGGEAGLFRAIAYALSSAGVLVLRYDDRGCGRSGGDFATATLTDLAADASAALSFLRARADAGPAGLAGHGEGGLVAARVAARDDRVRAVISLAAPAKRLDELLLERRARELRAQGTGEEALKGLLSGERRAYEAVRAAGGDWLVIDERKTFVGWMRERLQADPREAFAKVRVPLVIAHGTRDADVPADHADLLAAARPGAEVRRLEGLDHAFLDGRGRVDAEFLRFLAAAAGRHLK